MERHARKQDDWQRTAMFLQITEDLKAIDVRHLEIQEHQVNLAVLDLKDRVVTVTGLGNGISG